MCKDLLFFCEHMYKRLSVDKGENKRIRRDNVGEKQNKIKKAVEWIPDGRFFAVFFFLFSYSTFYVFW